MYLGYLNRLMLTVKQEKVGWTERGAGVRGTGYGVPGRGKHEVWWKTRGLVENTGSGGKHGEYTGFDGKHEFSWKTRDLSEKSGV